MRSNSDNSQLFGRAYLSEALRARAASAPKRVQSIAESVLRARPDIELVSELVEEIKITPLELFRDRATMSREEVEIDVSGDPRRDIFPSGRKVLIPGIKVVVSIPYRGDKELWHLQPSTYQPSGPRGTIRVAPGGTEGTLDIAIKQPADEPIEQIKITLDNRLRDIEFFLNSQRNDLAGYESQLQNTISSAIADRRIRLAKHDNLSIILGIPEAGTAISSTTSKSASPQPTKAPADQVLMGEKVAPVWDIFVSHASEDKDSFARPLAQALQEKGLKVWFDESSLRVGDSLRRSIDKGLSQSRFGIVVVSRAFLSKEWPQRELDGLIAREEDGQKVVLPIWHEITATDVRRRSPTLADRLAIPSSRGIAAVVDEILEVVRGS